MNENIDLTKILECTPKGMKLYSPLFGEVSLEDIESATHWPIVVSTADGDDGDLEYFLRDGRFYDNPNGECLLFPSKENRDWSTFNIIPKVGDVVKSVITQTVYIKGKWYDMTPHDKNIVTNPTWCNFARQLAKYFFELGVNARKGE